MEIATAQTEQDSVSPPRRRSGRPTADRIIEIDLAIREAAQAIFLDLGFEATNVDAIAAAAGVSKGTLYARYRSKEALFRCVVEDLLAKLSTRAGANDHLLPDDLEMRLRHHAAVLVTVFGWREYVLATRLVLNAAHAFPEIAQLWQGQGTKRYVALIADDIRRSADLPVNGSADPEFLANLFLHGLASWYRNEAATGPVDDANAAHYCNNIVGVIMSAVKASAKVA
jgi:TetR/AcrR family transcriptional regulator, mexJK operon transcriptional repressor